MIVEIFTYEDNFRHMESKAYNTICDWEKDYLLLRLSDKWVGHKIFNTTQTQYNAMTPTQRADVLVHQKFDKGAYINGKKE
jgi:hypothetical protein